MKLDISSRTSVEVQRKTSGKRPAYLAFEHKSGGDATSKWVFMTNKATQVLYKKRDEVASLLKRKKDDRIFLQHNQYAVASSQTVGFHKMDTHGHITQGKGLTLNTQEWQILFTHLPSLSAMVNARDISSQFKLNGQWHFGDWECVDAVEDIRAIVSPKFTDVMSWMYMYLLRLGICAEICTRCIGCKSNKPQYMEVHTCRQTWNEAIINYSTIVGSRLGEERDALERMFRRVLDELDLLPPFSVPDLIQNVLCSKRPCYVMQLLRTTCDDEIIPPEYIELFDKIIQTHYLTPPTSQHHDGAFTALHAN